MEAGGAFESDMLPPTYWPRKSMHRRIAQQYFSRRGRSRRFKTPGMWRKRWVVSAGRALSSPQRARSELCFDRFFFEAGRADEEDATIPMIPPAELLFPWLTSVAFRAQARSGLDDDLQGMRVRCMPKGLIGIEDLLELEVVSNQLPRI